MADVSWRGRLLRTMDDAGSLLILRGPSGFGKSVLLREWAASFQEPHKVIWVSLGPDPVPAGEFWLEVISAAGQAGILSAAPANAMSSAAAAGVLDVHALASRLAAGAPCLLAVDDYESARPDHRVLDDQIVELSQSHPRLRVAVATRSSTQFTSTRALMSGNITEITSEELAYTLPETQHLFDRTPRSDDDMAERMHAETAGYPLALHAAHTLVRRPWSSTTVREARSQMVNVQFETELWKLTDPAFVAMTCLPPFFDSALAQTVTGLSEEMLEKVLDDLEWHGFGRREELPDGSHTFTYVEHLRTPIRQRTLASWSRTALQEVGAPAIPWLSAHDPEAAFTLALELHLYAEAAAAYVHLLSTNSRRSTSQDLLGPISAVPPEACAAHPVLAFAHGLILVSEPGLADGAPVHLKVAAAPALAPDEVASVDEHTLVELALGATALRMLGRHREAGDAARRAVKLLRTADETVWSGDAARDMMVLRQLSLCLVQAGDFTTVQRVITWATARTTDSTELTDIAVGRTAIDAISGKVAQARDQAERSAMRAPAPAEESPFLTEIRRIGVAALQVEEFDVDSALATLADETPAVVSELRALRDWVLTHAALARGNGHTEALRILNSTTILTDPAPALQGWSNTALVGAISIGLLTGGEHSLPRHLTSLPTPFPGQVSPAKMLTHVLSGDSRSALEQLPALRDDAGHSLRSLTALHTIAAAAALRENERELAESLLCDLDHAYGRHQLQLPLLYLPADDLADMFDVGRRLGLKSWTALREREIPSPRFATARVSRLTDREQAVAQALLTHTSREQIAKALFVSENTIKTQLRSIYRKLGVTNRREVIDRILELGLVDDTGDRVPHMRLPRRDPGSDES